MSPSIAEAGGKISQLPPAGASARLLLSYDEGEEVGVRLREGQPSLIR